MGLKNTGKFPIEHIIKKEKQRIAKKAFKLKKKLLRIQREKLKISKEKILPIKNNVENQTTKINGNLFKVKTFALRRILSINLVFPY